MVKEYSETHQREVIKISHEALGGRDLELADHDFGIQIAKDGRVWICINGLAFIRFKPSIMKGEKK